MIETIKSTGQRAIEAMQGERGALSTEQIVLLSVALVLATIFFLFRDSIWSFIELAIAKVSSFSVDRNS